MRFLARRVAFLTIRHARRLIEPLVTRRILTESQFPTAFRARPRKPVTWIDGEGIPWCALLYGPLQYSRVLKPQRVEFEILTRIYFISGEATSQSVDKFYQVHCQLPNSEIAKTRDFHGEPPVFSGPWPLTPDPLKQISQPRRQHCSQLAFHRFVALAVGFVNGREDHVLKHFDIVLFHNFGIYLERDDLVISFHGDVHHTAAGRSIHAQLFHLARHFLLHLLGLFHHPLNVEPARKFHRVNLALR